MGRRLFSPKFAIATLYLLGSAAFVSAKAYGDVDVSIEPVSSVQGQHGYQEVWIRVVNRSKDEAYEIRLTLPAYSYGPGEDHLRSISRTIRVDADKTARTSLAYPLGIPISGSSLGVAIDGSEQQEPLLTDFIHSTRYYSTSGSIGGGAMPTVLYSRGVDTRFPDWAETTQKRMGLQKILPLDDPDDEPMPGMPGSPSSGITVAKFVRAEMPSANWSPNWLGYSSYDGIVLTDEDLRAMPATARSAIGQYVECGGSLLIIGKDPPLPGKWKLLQSENENVRECEAGFGTCFVIDAVPLAHKPWLHLPDVLTSWRRVLQPWTNTRSEEKANAQFPIVDDLGVPITGLLLLMLVFSIGAGPVTLVILNRSGRKLWLFWIVPLISAFTCLTVFVYIGVSEGWSGQARTVGITLLDENMRRASSLGWTAFYAPVSSGSGLHFSPHTEVNLQNGEKDDYSGYRSYRSRSSSASALSMDWTREQHLVSGWISPRVPAHFIIRKSDLRSEQVIFSAGPDGRPEAVNGLGATATDFWYCDEAGQLFYGKEIAAGAKASLALIDRPRSNLRSIGQLYNQDWTKSIRLAAEIPAILKPRTYVAILDAAPFFDEAMKNAGITKTQSVVIGIIREGTDEN